MTRDEKGYIQFQCDWTPADPPAVPAELLECRERMHRLGLIGVYSDGIGFGNISTRNPVSALETGFLAPQETRFPRQKPGFIPFLISGTATGSLPTLGPEHFAEVTAFDFASNSLSCRGQVKASSESLSHAAVYVNDPTAQAVIHVHHLKRWEALRDRVPTTDHTAEAGTPQMAWAIEELLGKPGVKEGGFFVMGGHREGLMAFGPSVAEAAERLLRFVNAATEAEPGA